MSNIFDQMEEDFEKSIIGASLDVVKNKELGGVAEVAKNIQAKEVQIADLESQLKDLKKEHLKLTDEDLPQMLAEIGMSEFKLDDGSSVTVKQTYGASIRVDNREEAYEWLRQKGHDDIIKNTIACQFGRGEDDQASAFHAFASKEGFPTEQKTEIHSGTLRAWVKDRVENGEEFPMELFGAWVGQRAVIKRSK
jgi:hypothetical protein|tara:strand:+ start:1191 stop:1772 length:582 start_codon:yes stop_codon:yes gene_type:complete